MAWRKPDAIAGKGVDSLLGKGASFEGKLECEGSVRLDGCFKGEIKAGGDIVVGQGARVEAQLTGREMLIAGEVHGRATAQGKLELTATGRLYGTLEAAGLVVEEGGILEGDCRMIVPEGSGNPGGEAKT